MHTHASVDRNTRPVAGRALVMQAWAPIGISSFRNVFKMLALALCQIAFVLFSVHHSSPVR